MAFGVNPSLDGARELKVHEFKHTMGLHDHPISLDCHQLYIVIVAKPIAKIFAAKHAAVA